MDLSQTTTTERMGLRWIDDLFLFGLLTQARKVIYFKYKLKAIISN